LLVFISEEAITGSCFNPNTLSVFSVTHLLLDTTYFVDVHPLPLGSEIPGCGLHMLGILLQ